MEPVDTLKRNVGEAATQSATTAAKLDTLPKCVALLLTLHTSNKPHTENKFVVVNEGIVAPSEAVDVVEVT